MNESFLTSCVASAPLSYLRDTLVEETIGYGQLDFALDEEESRHFPFYQLLFIYLLFSASQARQSHCAKLKTYSNSTKKKNLEAARHIQNKKRVTPQ